MKRLAPSLFLALSIVSLVPVLRQATLKTETRDIEYLSAADVKPIGPVSDFGIGNIFLNPIRDAYVIDGPVLDALDSNSFESYLVAGGTVIVKDVNVTSHQLKRKIDTNVADFDYSDMHDYFGFMVKRSGKDNRVVNVNLETVSRVIENDDVDLLETVPTVELVDSLLDNADQMGLIPEPKSAGEDLAVSADLDAWQPTRVASGTVMTLLYLYDDKDEYVGGYVTDLMVDRVAVVRDLTSGYYRTVFDQMGMVAIYPSEKFWIHKFGIRIYSGYTYVSTLDLISHTMTNLELGGNPGFPYSVVSGQLPYTGIWYSNTLGQNVVNNNDSGANRYWWSNSIYQDRGYSAYMAPIVRIVNGNNQQATAFSVRLEALEVIQTLYLIFNTKYGLDPKNRKELRVVLNADGSFYQQVISG